MKPADDLFQGLRKQVATILRRARKHPDLAGGLIREELGPVLDRLKKIAQEEPATALRVLFKVMEQLVPASRLSFEWDASLERAAMGVVARARSILAAESRLQTSRVDLLQAAERLYCFWEDDQEQVLVGLEETLLLLARQPQLEVRIRGLLREHLVSLPLVFPTALLEEQDLAATVWQGERFRAERLMGELLAQRGIHEYAVLVGRDVWRRNGDALDLIESLARAQQHEEAAAACRRALASPRTPHRERIRSLLAELVEVTGEGRDKRTRRLLEEEFLSHPCARRFQALKRVVQKEQWSRVRKRILGHLQKHQKAPNLLFALYLREEEWVEADGLATTQSVDARVLARGARLIQEERPEMAAGWLLLAAHQRVGQRRVALYPRVVADLLEVRKLANKSCQSESFQGVLRRFRSRYTRRSRLMELMDQAGLL